MQRWCHALEKSGPKGQELARNGLSLCLAIQNLNAWKIEGYLHAKCDLSGIHEAMQFDDLFENQ